MKKVVSIMMLTVFLLGTGTIASAETLEEIVEIDMEEKSLEQDLYMLQSQLAIEEARLDAELVLEGWLPEEDYKARTTKYVVPILVQAQLDYVVESFEEESLNHAYDLYIRILEIRLKELELQSLLEELALRQDYYERYVGMVGQNTLDGLELAYEIDLLKMEAMEVNVDLDMATMDLMGDINLDLESYEDIALPDLQFNIDDVDLLKEEFVDSSSMQLLSAKIEAADLTYEIALGTYGPEEVQAKSDWLKLESAQLSYDKTLMDMSRRVDVLVNNLVSAEVRLDLAKSMENMMEKNLDVTSLLMELGRITLDTYTDDQIKFSQAAYAFKENEIMVDLARLELMQALQINLWD